MSSEIRKVLGDCISALRWSRPDAIGAANLLKVSVHRDAAIEAAEQFLASLPADGELIVKPEGGRVVAEPVAWQYRLHFLNRFGGVTEWTLCSSDYELSQDHSDLVRFEKRALYSAPPTVPDEVMEAAERMCHSVDPARLMGTGLDGVTLKHDMECSALIRDFLKSLGGAR